MRIEAQARDLFDRLRAPRILLLLGIALFLCVMLVTGTRL